MRDVTIYSTKFTEIAKKTYMSIINNSSIVKKRSFRLFEKVEKSSRQAQTTMQKGHSQNGVRAELECERARFAWPFGPDRDYMTGC